MDPLLGWKPLLEGPDAEVALRALEEITGLLLDPGGNTGASLAEGDGGVALFFAYRWLSDPLPRYEARAMDCLSRAVKGLDGLTKWEGLFQGPLGVAWCVEHLGGWFLDAGGGDPNGEMDAWLAERLRHPGPAPGFDLISGLAGLGLYALSRMRGSRGEDLLRAVVARLGAGRTETPHGRAWFTPPEHLHEHQREEAPQGYFNLGMSHGAAGAVAFLARVVEARPEWGELRSLLEESVAWLLAQRGEEGGASWFPPWVGPGTSRRPSRLAWCYGDLGIATAILAAGKAAGNEAWTEAGTAIACHAAERGEEGSWVRDPALCHGAGGVSLAFSRFHQLTGMDCFRSAARRWILWALDRYRPGEDVAGFPLWIPRSSTTQPRLPYLGLLEGAAGLGLVLLSATRPVEPRWDRMLLLS